jgi:hypothetical protein
VHFTNAVFQILSGSMAIDCKSKVLGANVIMLQIPHCLRILNYVSIYFLKYIRNLWNKSFMISWRSLSWSSNSPPFTETEVPLPCNQESPTPKLHSILSQMSPAGIPWSFKIHFNIILLPTTKFPRRALHVFLLKFCMYFSSPEWVIHLPPISSYPKKHTMRYQQISSTIAYWNIQYILCCVCFLLNEIFLRKILRPIRRNWNQLTNMSKIRQYKISWKLDQVFSCSYIQTDGRTNRHGGANRRICATFHFECVSCCFYLTIYRLGQLSDMQVSILLIFTLLKTEVKTGSRKVEPQKYFNKNDVGIETRERILFAYGCFHV